MNIYQQAMLIKTLQSATQEISVKFAGHTFGKVVRVGFKDG